MNYSDRVIFLPNGGVLEEYSNGDRFYLLNDNFHRVEGPAVELHNGIKGWWVNGKLIPCTTQEQFERLMRLKAFW
jgi:hypothetical protein